MTYYGGGTCYNLFSTALDTIDDMADSASNERYDEIYSLAYNKATGLQSQNENLLTNSCPVIY